MNRDDSSPAPDGPASARFQVVVNHEEQYALWPEGRDLPIGWSGAGKRGTREECLAFVEEVWTDMTPRGLRGAPSAPRPTAAGEAR